MNKSLIANSIQINWLRNVRMFNGNVSSGILAEININIKCFSFQEISIQTIIIISIVNFSFSELHYRITSLHANCWKINFEHQ